MAFRKCGRVSLLTMALLHSGGSERCNLSAPSSKLGPGLHVYNKVTHQSNSVTTFVLQICTAESFMFSHPSDVEVLSHPCPNAWILSPFSRAVTLQPGYAGRRRLHHGPPRRTYAALDSGVGKFLDFAGLFTTTEAYAEIYAVCMDLVQVAVIKAARGSWIRLKIMCALVV